MDTQDFTIGQEVAVNGSETLGFGAFQGEILALNLSLGFVAVKPIGADGTAHIVALTEIAPVLVSGTDGGDTLNS